MKRVLPIALILALLIAGFLTRERLLPFGQSLARDLGDQLSAVGLRKASEDGALVASGTIEAETISVGSTLAGRIITLYVREGQEVAAGDLIADLDTALLDAEGAQTEAAKKVADAQLALVRAPFSPADLAVAQAGVAQAQAAADAAYTAWQDALALLSAPDELDVALAEAETQVQTAEEQVVAAQAQASAADLQQAQWERVAKMLQEGFTAELPNGSFTHVDSPAEKLNEALLQWNLASQKTWEAYAKLHTATAGRDAEKQALADLQAEKADPQEGRAKADAAESAYRAATAAVATAQAGVELLKAGASQEQIDSAQARVDQADRAVQELQARRAQTRIVAPQTGTVTSVVMHSGEVVAPGAPIVQLGDLDTVTLTAYVPEPQLGKVSVGAPASVAVDSFPGRVFSGRVSHIADRAEFTPKNVQTIEGRANTVFAVKIDLLNADRALKPGMPADATFGTEQASVAQGGPSGGADAQPPGAVAASGTIEATEITVGAELGGRAVSVNVEEGTRVAKGQLLVQIDDAEWQARLAQAEAAVSTAKAELARVTAAPRAEAVAQAEAEVRQAEATLAGAEKGLDNAKRLRENPQKLDAEVNSARSGIQTAIMAVDAAKAQLKGAQVLQESLPNPGSDEDRTRRGIYDQQVTAAEASLRMAQAQERGARAVLDRRLAIRKKPVSLEAAVHQAGGQVTQAEAAVGTARAMLAQLQAPARAEAVELAQAQLRQAEAAAALIRASLEKLSVTSPAAGAVMTLSIHPGEVAEPGQPLMKIADLGDVKVTIYVPTARIGQVQLGQAAQVTTDAYPGGVFEGTVTHIADQAEFTPKNVQTQEERVKTVIAVEISLDNSEGLLKPGMPADARIE